MVVNLKSSQILYGETLRIYEQKNPAQLVDKLGKKIVISTIFKQIKSIFKRY